MFFKCILFVLIFSSVSFASQDYLLFREGVPVLEYQDYVEDLPFEKGDTLIFSKDKKFEFIKFLGSGGTTLVLEVKIPGEKKHYALRMPKFDHDGYYVDKYIEYTYVGYQKLKNTGIRIPEIYDYRKERFILMELIEDKLEGEEYFFNYEEHDNKVLEKALHSLIEFARSSAKLEMVSDFRADQLIYSIKNDEWFLADWLNVINYTEDVDSKSIFDQKDFMIDFQDGTGDRLYHQELSSPEIRRGKIIIEELSRVVREARFNMQEIDKRETVKRSFLRTKVKSSKELFKLFDFIPSNQRYWNTQVKDEFFQSSHLFNKFNAPMKQYLQLSKRFKLKQSDKNRVLKVSFELSKDFDEALYAITTSGVHAPEKSEFIFNNIEDLFDFEPTEKQWALLIKQPYLEEFEKKELLRRYVTKNWKTDCFKTMSSLFFN